MMGFCFTLTKACVGAMIWTLLFLTLRLVRKAQAYPLRHAV